MTHVPRRADLQAALSRMEGLVMCRNFIAAITLAAVTGGSLWAQTRTPEVQFKAAEQKELAEGDLKGAITEYEKVVSGNNHELAAQALLRIADIHRRLGDVQADKVYERIIRDFKDQAAAVSTARARLGSPMPQARDMGASRRFIPIPEPDRTGLSGLSVSRDGRFIAYVADQPGGRAVLVRDLGTGRVRAVSPVAKGIPPNLVQFPVFSPDGQQLAYTWTTENDWELRIANLRDSGVPRFRKLLGDSYVEPFDWTPDSRSIVVALTHHDKSADISLVSAVDGSRRVVTPVGDERWAEAFVSPDGKYLARDHRRRTTDATLDVFVMPLGGGPEVNVTDHPADDRLVGWSPDGRHVLFTSDRNTGTPGLYALPMDDGRPGAGRPVLIETNTGRMMSPGFTKTGALYHVRPRGNPDTSRIQELEIVTFDFESGAVGAPTLVGAERPANYTAAAWSKDGKYLAYHTTQTPDAPAPCVTCPQSVFIRSMDTGDTRELRVDTVPGSLDWSADGRLLVSAVPTTGVHRIDTQTGRATLISAGDRRRAVWSRDGMTIYYYANNNGAALVAYDVASGTERTIIRRPNLGAPVLSPDGRQIVTVSNDAPTKSRSVLLIPPDGGEPRILHRVELPTTVALLMWAPDSRSILIMTGEQREVWRLPVEGQPRKLFNDTERRLGDGPFPLAVHPDGRRIALVQRSAPAALSTQAGLWVLENFLPARK